ncbi:Sterol uptake control protein 2 [Penicillium ucsense]|uniref:Sterol uptake control protein 2 n=1 Tax=Penicillium ucsense TaxID=2839758 RepID=A0A8J8WGY1_9EURO|nr:Sterol uptake control protein 2 [Penicillium ucsense]KAF7739173.1 Sterol uptake control protein 2 [Penicillium ucsense]
MPPRRAHTKSRNGCDQCKRRRVKCDEKGPPCSNCISRELNCTYLKAPPRDGTAVRKRSTASASTRELEVARPLAPISPASTPSSISGVRDLELMHKFATETFSTVCTAESKYHVWQIVIPRLALQYDFLMNGILALAALHIATTTESPTSLAYIDTALQYHNLSFAPFRAAIDNLTQENCEAVLAQSIVTTVIGIALPRLTASRDETSNMTENMLVVFQLLQGVKKIILIGRSWIKINLYSRHRELYEAAAPTELDGDAAAALDRLARLNEEAVAGVDAQQYRTNKEVIGHLRQCFTLYMSSRDPGEVLSWLAAVDKEFVDTVRRRQPLALLILMHWGVLLGELHGRWWWAQGSGKSLVAELSQSLSDAGARWSEFVTWPRRRLGL